MHRHGRRTRAWKTAKVGPLYGQIQYGGLEHDMVRYSVTMGGYGSW